MRNPNSKRLYEAAHNGDVRTLLEIAGRYPSLLYGGSWVEAPYESGLPEPPLQVAAFYGHLDLVERMVAMEPALAHHSDKKGLSPLHMAAANGHVNIITRLLRVDPDLCFLCDDDGRNPLHFAAMNGHLAALKLLVENIGARRDVTTFINAKDDHGFTLLHLAVHNQHEIVEYLVTFKIETNALNSKGFTPLDMLINYPMPNAYPNLLKTTNFLRGYGATSSSALTASATSPELWARKKDALMVVASLIATMAFQAAVNPPGGVWQDDGNSGQRAGKSVMASKSPDLYTLFIVSATSAFAFSLVELTLHMSNTVSNSVAAVGLVAYAKYISTVALVAAYSLSVAFLTMLPEDEKTATGFRTMLCMTVVVILVFVVAALRFGFARKGHPASVIQFPPPK
ncbi:ankyrin-3-like [Momordica charantia]|uniref:Ankyrin-3-like n=1 Tax=Momordica charantia TaxID=3673 RepID=A0A6J1BQ97_MOMCH|nr:ankyrin-3-like [Momordica charantia]